IDAVASGSGSAIDTLRTPVTGVTVGSGSVLGVAFSGIATVQAGASVPTFSYQAPNGGNAITLTLSGGTVTLSDADTVTDPNTQAQTVTTTTINFTAPTGATGAIVVSGDPQNANTITVGSSLSSYAGKIEIIAGSGDVVLKSHAVTLTLAQGA